MLPQYRSFNFIFYFINIINYYYDYDYFATACNAQGLLLALLWDQLGKAKRPYGTSMIS